MTCIVGYAKDGKVYIGGDSAGVGNYDLRIMNHPKVFKRDNMIFGYTSSFRMGQLLQYSLIIPPHDEGHKSDHEYLCTDFINAIKECFKTNDYASKRDEVVHGGEFLLGYKGKIYRIYEDFQVSLAVDGYDACGCGEQYALGAMSVMAGYSNDPSTILYRALTAAAYFSAGVSAPFHYEEI